MAQPTFVAEYESTWSDSGTTRTVSVTRDSGDRLVAVASTSDNGATLATPTLSGVTWTLATSRGGASNTWVYIWTGTATTSTTSDLSITRSGTTQLYGVNVFRFTGSDGFGSSPASGGSNSGGPSQAITTGQADSTICCISADWNAVDGASRTARTISGATYTERTYARNASYMTVYAGTWEGVGTAGSKTVGWSAPSTQDYSIAAVEVLGTASSSGATADTASTTLAGQTPTLDGSGAASTAGDVAVMTLTGQTPTAAGSGAATVAADTAALSLAGLDVTASGGASSTAADTALLSLAGQDAALAGTGAASITADTGAAVLAGQETAAGGTGAVTVAADPGAAVLTGQTPGASGSSTASMAADAAQVTLTGQTPTAASEGGPQSVAADTAVLTLVGLTPAAGGSGAAAVASDTGVLVLTGQTPGTSAHTSIAADTASLVLASLTASAIGAGSAPTAADPAALILGGQTPMAAGTGGASRAADVGVLQLAGVQTLVFSGAIPVVLLHLGTHREAGNLGTWRPGHLGTHRESAALE